MRAPPSRQLTDAEARADAILAEIPDADFDAFCDAAVGLLLSAARRPPNDGQGETETADVA